MALGLLWDWAWKALGYLLVQALILALVFQAPLRFMLLRSPQENSSLPWC